MKVFLATLSLVCISLLSQAQTKAEAKIKVKAEAKKMGAALVKKDYDVFVRSTYPKAVNNADGGLKKLAENLKGQVERMEAEGNKVLAIWPGEPSNIIDTAGEWQCTVPQKLTMELPQGKLTTQTTLVALSPDKGITWYFIDAAERNLSAIRTIFPNISSKLVIPKPSEPIFEQAK